MTSVIAVLGLVAIPVTPRSAARSWPHFGHPVSVRSIVQHVAAGLVFGAASLELLPDLVREHSSIGTVIGFALGIATMLTLRGVGDRYALSLVSLSAGGST